MQPKKFLPKKGPEAKIQDELILFLRAREWYVRPTHGGMYQSGFPDLWCSHRTYGYRWIEVKVAGAYKFTAAQKEQFPLMCANGTRIWILVAATEFEYKKLFKSPNLWTYLKW